MSTSSAAIERAMRPASYRNDPYNPLFGSVSYNPLFLDEEASWHAGVLHGVGYAAYPALGKQSMPNRAGICAAMKVLIGEVPMVSAVIGQVPYEIDVDTFAYLMAVVVGLRFVHVDQITRKNPTTGKMGPTGTFRIWIPVDLVHETALRVANRVLFDKNGMWVAYDGAQMERMHEYVHGKMEKAPKRPRGTATFELAKNSRRQS